MNTFVIGIFVLKITFQSIDCQLVNPTSTILLASESTNKRLYNESCNYKDECKVTLNCTNHQCKCLAGWVWSSDDNMCFPFEVGSCNDSIECQDQDKNTMCYKHKCQCQIGFKFDSNRYCTLPNNLIGSQCLTDQQCISDIPDSLCYFNKCTCKIFYSAANNMSECKQVECHDDLVCGLKNTSDPNAYCDTESNQCSCRKGFYWFNVTKCTQVSSPEHSWTYYLSFVAIGIVILFGLCFAIKKILCCFLE